MRLQNSNIVYNKILKDAPASGEYAVATYKGVTLKTMFYLLMVIVGGVIGLLLANFVPAIYIGLIAVSGILTFVLALISFFSVNACKVTGTLYCLTEGVLVGTISIVVASVLQGAVTIALLSTVAVFAVVCLLFLSNVIKVDKKFVKFLLIFAISFLFVNLITGILILTGAVQMNMGLAMLFSAITIFLATLYLFFDLERIRQVVEGGYPKQMEWFVAFGLAFTLIWLYVEILRLVVLIADRN